MLTGTYHAFAVLIVLGGFLIIGGIYWGIEGKISPGLAASAVGMGLLALCVVVFLLVISARIRNEEENNQTNKSGS